MLSHFTVQWDGCCSLSASPVYASANPRLCPYTGRQATDTLTAAEFAAAMLAACAWTHEEFAGHMGISPIQ